MGDTNLVGWAAPTSDSRSRRSYRTSRCRSRNAPATRDTQALFPSQYTKHFGLHGGDLFVIQARIDHMVNCAAARVPHDQHVAPGRITGRVLGLEPLTAHEQES